MITQEIIAQPETAIDKAKLRRDLGFIKSFQQLASNNQWRIVISGGYGLDILLGKITRNHGDVDIILYGNAERSKVKTVITKNLDQLLHNPEVTIKDEVFYSDIDVNSRGLGANIYFVETVDDPRVDLHRVKKIDGEIVLNSDDRFPPPFVGKLGDLEIEVQNPNLHLADILFKRRGQENRHTHDQDIKNLSQLTNKRKVESLLEQM